jgi:two-component system, cell cycle response regulator
VEDHPESGEFGQPGQDAETFSRLILKHYDVLSQTGILNFVQKLQEENNNLRKVIQAGKDIAKQGGILMIVETVAKVLNDRFIPASLTFLLEAENSNEAPDIIHYQNMARTEVPFSIEKLEPYRFFFNLAPATVSFPVFEYMIGRPALTEPFKTLRPKIVMPVLGFGQVYGFAIIGEKIVGGEYTESELTFLDDVMQFASIGLQNNIHYLKAITDFKTRLYNHAYITSRLEMELSRVKRYGCEIAVILTDVDLFKKFNDTYGHLAGDKMLMKIAEVFIETIRKGDVAGRFGGEEFVLILAQCSRKNACMVAERIRKRVEKILILDEGRELKATISLGVRHVTQADCADADTAIAQADKALYKAKENGRNRSFIFNTGKAKASKDTVEVKTE